MQLGALAPTTIQSLASQKIKSTSEGQFGTGSLKTHAVVTQSPDPPQGEDNATGSAALIKTSIASAKHLLREGKNQVDKAHQDNHFQLDGEGCEPIITEDLTKGCKKVCTLAHTSQCFQ